MARKKVPPAEQPEAWRVELEQQREREAQAIAAGGRELAREVAHGWLPTLDRHYPVRSCLGCGGSDRLGTCSAGGVLVWRGEPNDPSDPREKRSVLVKWSAIAREAAMIRAGYEVQTLGL
jgi:hypothetical protein